MSALTVGAVITLLAGHDAMDISLADAAHFFGPHGDRREVRWACSCKARGSFTVDIPAERVNRTFLHDAVRGAWREHVASVIAAASEIANRHATPHLDDWAMEHFGRAQRMMGSLGRNELWTVPAELGGVRLHWRIDADLLNAMVGVRKIDEPEVGCFELMGLPVAVHHARGSDDQLDGEAPVFELVVS